MQVYIIIGSILSLIAFLFYKLKAYSLDIENKKQYISNLESKITIYENVKTKTDNIKKIDKTNASDVISRMRKNKL